MSDMLIQLLFPWESLEPFWRLPVAYLQQNLGSFHNFTPLQSSSYKRELKQLPQQFNSTAFKLDKKQTRKMQGKIVNKIVIVVGKSYVLKRGSK